MHTELELKILDIDVTALDQKLLALGAVKKPRTLQRRYVYDFRPVRQNSRIRLRDDGRQTTLTIKEILDDTIEGTKELEVKVENFDTAHELLGKLWYEPRAYQENRRTSYVLGNNAIEIDERPLIPAYLEIEGQSVEEIQQLVRDLGYTVEETTSENTKKIYARYGIDLDSLKILSFAD